MNERAFQALALSKKKGAAGAKEQAAGRALQESIRQLVGGLSGEPVADRAQFEQVLDTAASKAGLKLPAPARKAVLSALIRAVLTAPGQRLTVREGRDVLQSRVVLGEPAKEYLVRVVIDVDRDPVEVVTVYKTSRPERYWQEEP